MDSPPGKSDVLQARRGRSDDEGGEEEEEKKKRNFLFFDFECMQETGVHVPNLVVVQDDEGHEWVFKGPNTCKNFCDWLFENMYRAVCIAHNFKGYDSYFTLKYLYDKKIRPGLIMNGPKIMELSVNDPEIRFIDSLNCCLNFAQKVKGLCKINPFEHYITIASIWARVWFFVEKYGSCGHTPDWKGSALRR